MKCNFFNAFDKFGINLEINAENKNANVTFPASGDCGSFFVIHIIQNAPPDINNTGNYTINHRYETMIQG